MNKDDWSESISFAVSSTQVNFNSRDILRAVIFELPRSISILNVSIKVYTDNGPNRSSFSCFACVCVLSFALFDTEEKRRKCWRAKWRVLKRVEYISITTSLYVRATLYVHEYVHFTVASVFNHAYKTCLPSSTAPTFWRLSDNKILVVDKAQDNVKNLFNATLICAAAKKSP